MINRYSAKRLAVAVLLGSVCAAAPSTWAHWTHSGQLGSASTAVDILQYTCAASYNGSNFTAFEARVRDKLPVATPYVRVQVQRVSPLLNGLLRTDPNSNSAVGDGDTVAGGTASPMSNVATTAGDSRVYKIYVSKSATGIEFYELDYHCLYGATPHPAPGALIYLQNQ